MTAKTWFALMASFAFLSVGSFFQINSFWADKNHFNGVFGWLGIGIVSGLIAIYCLSKVTKNTNTGGGSSVQ